MLRHESPRGVRFTARVEEWRRQGERVEFRGRRIHVHRRSGAGPTLLLLHGFPSSSYDWRGVLERLGDRAVLAFDFLGFGLSDKPRDHVYSLSWQADLTEELVGRFAKGPIFIVAHDMGTSVATELMARGLGGELDMELVGAFLFNGSMLQARARPTVAQKLLRSRLGPLAARLTTRQAFSHQFRSVFSAAHPPADEELDDQWALITAQRGHRLGHELVRYMDERERYADRWHGAFRDWPKRLSLAWGMSDPVARLEVLAGLRELRPSAAVTELAGVGHYPQIEAPKRLSEAILRATSAP